MFDPADFDDDIYVKQMKGMGRGKGFIEVWRGSALDDQIVVSKVKSRLLELVRILNSHGLLTSQEVCSVVALPSPADSEEVRRLKEKGAEQEELLGNYRSNVNKISRVLAEAAGVEIDEGTYIGNLEAAANAIKDELSSSRATVEEAAGKILEIIDVQDDSVDEDPQKKLERAIDLLREDYGAVEAASEEGY